MRVAVQMHLKDQSYWSRKFNFPTNKLRIVRGAGVYKDDKEYQLTDQTLIDDRMVKLARSNIRSGNVVYLGSMTNFSVLKRILDFLDQESLPHSWIVLESLHGLFGESLRLYAMQHGVKVVVYLPITIPEFKDEWKPYCLRRMPMMRKYVFDIILNRFKVFRKK